MKVCKQSPRPSMAIGLVLSMACSGAAEEQHPSDVRVRIGAGLEQYEPLDAEPQVTLIAGIQGAYHVWTSFIAYGFDTDIVHMELSTLSEGIPESLIEMPGLVSLQPATDAAGVPVLTSVGWPALVYDAKCAHGRRLRLSLTITDEATGLSASDVQHCIVNVPAELRETDCASE